MKKSFLLFALIGFATSAFAANANKANVEKEVAGKAQISINQIAEMMGTEEAEIESFFGLETQTVKIYNAQDELVAEGNLDFAGQAQEETLAKALRQASRLMTIGNTHFYRIND